MLIERKKWAYVLLCLLSSTAQIYSLETLKILSERNDATERKVALVSDHLGKKYVQVSQVSQLEKLQLESQLIEHYSHLGVLLI